MKRFSIIFFLIPFLGLAQQTPAWVDDAVRVSLYFSDSLENFTCKKCDMKSKLLSHNDGDLQYGDDEEAWTEDIRLERTQTQNLFIDLAKLNAHKAYYRELYKQGDNFQALPVLKKYVYDTEVSIHRKYHVSSSRHLYDLTGGNGLPVYALKCDRESKSLQEIHDEIDNWVNALNKEKKIKLFENGSLLFKAWINSERGMFQGGSFLSFDYQYDVTSEKESAYSAGRNTYLATLKELQRVAVKYGYEFDNVEAFLSQHMNKLLHLNTGSIKMRQTSSIFKFSIDVGDYHFVNDAILIDHNDWRVNKDAEGIKLSPYPYEPDNGRDFNLAYDWYTYEIIRGVPETLFDFVNKLLVTEGMGIIHNFPGLSNITTWLANKMKLPFEENYDYKSTYDKSKNRFYMNYNKSYDQKKYWKFYQSNLQKYDD